MKRGHKIDLVAPQYHIGSSGADEVRGVQRSFRQTGGATAPAWPVIRS
jgi:hypothetical protein